MPLASPTWSRELNLWERVTGTGTSVSWSTCRAVWTDADSLDLCDDEQEDVQKTERERTEARRERDGRLLVKREEGKLRDKTPLWLHEVTFVVLLGIRTMVRTVAVL